MALPARNIRTHFTDLIGGLDLVTPAIKKPAGRCIAAENYEPHPKGYQRIDGIERYDGRARPSQQSYSVLNYDQGTAAITEGQTVTGASSGATGKALIDQVVSSGSYGGGNAAGYLVLGQVSGTFTNNENLQVSSVTKCVADGTATDRGAANDTDDETWLQDAIETARTAIQAPTGSGAIRGVWVYNGSVWCFRDNAGGTAGQLYKATTAGWVLQSLGSRVSWTTGTAEVTAGQTVTGASSGATGVVTRVAKRSGTYGGGDARGQFIFATITGTFTNGENLQVSGVTKCVASGGSAAITLPAGGHYDFVNFNFFGASDFERMYFTNGQGTAMEWDGTVMVPIVTGMTVDTPTHLTAHKNHLFLSFAGGSLQHSSPGDPYAWSPLTGSAELAVGQDITGLQGETVDVLAIVCRNRIALLYGSGIADWVLKALAEDAGGVEWTLQRVGRLVYLDDVGLRSLETTQNYGDFNLGTMTQLVEPLFRTKRANSVTAVASMRVRRKNQYRVFWSDGTGLTVYLGRKSPEAMPFDLGITVNCACSSEDSNGNEILLVGDSTGQVYEIDAGTSLDGEDLTSYLRLAFNHCGSPYLQKIWRRAILEIDGQGTTSLSLAAEFDYGDADRVPTIGSSLEVTGGGGIWDESDWNEFVFDAAVEGRAKLALDGRGANVSLSVASTATYEKTHVVHGLTLHYSPRGLAK